MQKIKHLRTADCVVGGFRWYKGGEGKAVGSLLLGLYDDDGVLHHVGHTASFKAAGSASSWPRSWRRIAPRTKAMGSAAAARPARRAAGPAART